MITLVKLIGLLLAVLGVAYILEPKILKLILAFFQVEKRVYIASGIRILIGIILLAGAPQCRMPWIVVIIGILALVSGVLALILGVEKCKEMIKKFEEKPTKTLRMLSLIPIALGLILLYAA